MQERWKGRNDQKDALRSKVWQRLENENAAVGNPWSKIPNFVGAEAAASQLVNTPEWKNAQVVKCNPDSAQAPVRKLALSQGKCVYTPVPELVKDFPFLLLDPVLLDRKGIEIEDVMYAKGAIQHGIRCRFDQMKHIDFAVVGCVAVTKSGGRTGKGAGFADLEMGLFRHYGILDNEVPVVSTVHDIQLVGDDEIVMENHDTPLDWIATPTSLIKTNTSYASPGPVIWEKLRKDQFESIPFLKDLQKEIV